LQGDIWLTPFTPRGEPDREYDNVGVEIPFIRAASGFAGAFFNPFTVGIAQGIAGLPSSLPS
jgi:hypothetical protein